MGLDDTLPDDVSIDDSSSSGGRRKSPSKDDDTEYKVIGTEPNQKKFTEEKWKEVKRVIQNQMEPSVNEVVNNFPAQKRYETLHEAALIAEKDKEEVKDDLQPKQECLHCGNYCDDETAVVIEGEYFCVNHPAGVVRGALDGTNKDY